MYLFCPIGNYKVSMQDRCSDFFGKILDVGAQIYVTSLTLSEFSNKYFHIDFQIWKGEEEKDFKQNYRKTKRYRSTFNDIITHIESRILGVSVRIDDVFTKVPIKDLCERLEYMGYNDSYYVELGKMHNLKIVTNDRDFLSVRDDITILTFD